MKEQIMTRKIAPLLVLAFSACVVDSAEAQVYYPTQPVYSSYQPATYSSVRSYYHQPSVSTYFHPAPVVQSGAVYQPAATCQPVSAVSAAQSYPAMSMLSPTPLLITSDSGCCERIKEIEKKIAALKAELGDAGTSSVQAQLDLHEKEIERQAQEFKALGATIVEIKQTIQVLADEIEKNNNEDEDEDEDEVGKGAVDG
jgi:hypothetical protein